MVNPGMTGMIAIVYVASLIPYAWSLDHISRYMLKLLVCSLDHVVDVLVTEVPGSWEPMTIKVCWQFSEWYNVWRQI